MTLKEARTAAGLSQRQLSAACAQYKAKPDGKPISVSVSTISRIERGLSSFGDLRIDKVFAICAATNVDPQDFIEYKR